MPAHPYDQADSIHLMLPTPSEESPLHDRCGVVPSGKARPPWCTGRPRGTGRVRIHEFCRKIVWQGWEAC